MWCDGGHQGRVQQMSERGRHMYICLCLLVRYLSEAGLGLAGKREEKKGEERGELEKGNSHHLHPNGGHPTTQPEVSTSHPNWARIRVSWPRTVVKICLIHTLCVRQTKRSLVPGNSYITELQL